MADLMSYRTATATDSFTVRFTLTPHLEPMLTMAFLAIMPRHALDSIPPDRMANAAFNHNPIGNGAFRFVEYHANDRWVFAANESYPEGLGGRPYIDRVIWRVIPENAAQVTELLTGTADLILAPRAEDFNSFANQAGVRGIAKPARQFHFIGWNGRRAPLGDARVRRALAMAIDRAEILQLLRGGHGELAAGPVAPFHWAFPDTIQPLPFDTAAARALLAEAGIRDTNGDGKLEKRDGQPFTIELKIQANNAFNRDVAQMVQSDLAAIGVTLNVQPTEWMTLIGDISSQARNFDAVLMGWNADFRINIRDLFHSAARGGDFQLASYGNPQLDALIDSLADVTDRSAAAPLYARVQTILRDEQPWTLMYYVPSLFGMRDRVRGSVMDVRGVFVNLPEWWLADAR
jgi:peptide/nickel transport system substrate-binding protein